MKSLEKAKGCLRSLFSISLLPIMAFFLLAVNQAAQDMPLLWVALVVCLIVLGSTQKDHLRERLICFFQNKKAFRQSSGVRTVKTYEGYLEGYWETGWEGRIAYALSVEGLGHPLFLEKGQRLTIYAEDGSILWSGLLCFVKRRWWDKHNLPYEVWSDVKQVGVSYAQWMAWFVHNPPLKAVVEVETPP